MPSSRPCTVSIVSSPGVICNVSSPITNTSVISGGIPAQQPLTTSSFLPESTLSNAAVLEGATTSLSTLSSQPSYQSEASISGSSRPHRSISKRAQCSMQLRLCEIFPCLTFMQATLLMEYYDHDLHNVTEVMLQEEVSSHQFASILLERFRVLRLSSNRRTINIRPGSEIKDGITEIMLGGFDVSENFEINLTGNDAYDLGGVRRNFLSTFLEKMPSALNLGEENNDTFFVTCNAEGVRNQHYRRLGELIISSLLQEGPDFARLPKAVYYYWIGGIETAIPYLTTTELPMSTEDVIKKVSVCLPLYSRSVYAW